MTDTKLVTPLLGARENPDKEGRVKMDLCEIGRVYLPICCLLNHVVYKLVNPGG